MAHKDSLICIKVSFNDHKYGILNKTLSLKGARIFINDDLILEDQVESRKEVQQVKKSRTENEQ